MATLCHFPSLFSREPFLLHKEQQKYKLYGNFQQYPPQKRFNICVCSLKKPRVRRKVKSNAELCNEIREFVSAVGLPDGYVPSMKELSQHGRSDLANIVRRRGYKLIKELLATSVIEGNTKQDTSNAASGLDNVENSQENKVTERQDEMMNSIIEDAASTEVSILDHNLDSQNTDVDSVSYQNSFENIEYSSDLSLDKEVSDTLRSQSQEYGMNGHSLSAEVPILESELPTSSVNPDARSHSQSHSDTEFPVNLSDLENSVSNSYGQDDDLLNKKEEFILSTKVSEGEKTYPSSSKPDPAPSRDESSVSEETSANLSIEEESSQNLENDYRDVNAENSFGSEASLQDYNRSAKFNQDEKFNDSSPDDSSVPEKSSANLSMEEERLHNSESDHGNVNKENSFSIEASSQGHYTSPNINTGDSSQEHYTSPNINQYSGGSEPIRMTTGYSSNSTLEEKVANFLKNGILDIVEDDVSSMLHESATDTWNTGARTAEETIEQYPSELSGTKTTATIGDDTLTANQDAINREVNKKSWDDYSLADGPSSADLYLNLNEEAVQKNNQAEINHLKFMLHQKEMELSRLKEQIEKEKAALSALQTKAEEEISKAQRLISEKDAELDAAEESLTGLKEVEIQYTGHGEIVELAGSFNGWHHHIKLDPEPSSSITESIVSRKPKLWSTRLWLYPGTYEIKFIVDGHWMLDPQRESITKGSICNNILKVER